MRLKEELILLMLFVCITTAGCLDDYPVLSEETPWTFEVNGHVEQDNETATYVGDVRLTGSTSAPAAIRDVMVRFVDDTNETMRIVSYGTFNDSRRGAPVNESFDHPPKYVLVHVGEVRYNGTEGTILGLVRSEDGFYDEYYEYDPFEELSTVEEQA